GDLLADLRTGFLFYTSLPIPHPPSLGGADVARAGWVAPLAGALVGAIGAAVYWLAASAGLPPLVAAALTLAALFAVTGCVHEDGLADPADGFGGGATKARKLEIMHDSAVGAYGACTLILSLLLRGSALAGVAEPELVAPALIAAHASARATI